jgi:hypothetical protein
MKEFILILCIYIILIITILNVDTSTGIVSTSNLMVT